MHTQIRYYPFNFFFHCFIRSDLYFVCSVICIVSPYVINALAA